MKQSNWLWVTLLFLGTARGQQKMVQDANAELRPEKGFHAIEVSSGIRLYLTQGPEDAVAVSATPLRYRDQIVTRVEGGVLKIYYSWDRGKVWDWHDRKLVAYVSAKVIDALDASSGAWVETEGSIRSDKLMLHFSSGAVFNGRVETGELRVRQSSGAEATLYGKATRAHFEGSSGSVCRGAELLTDECEATCSSGAEVHISVSRELDADASTGGAIGYRSPGTLQQVSINHRAGGSVYREGGR
jgi:hypothetical protein